MSAPPTSSPLTKTRGIVGQPERLESSWRKRGSGRMSTAVTGAPAGRRAERGGCELPQATKLGVPFMKSATGSVSMISLIWSPSVIGALSSFRLDPELVDRAIRERRGERLADQTGLFDVGEPV